TAQANARLAAAQILLEFTTGSFAKAERLLSAVVDEGSHPPGEAKTAALGLLVYALAAQGNLDAASQQVERVADGGLQSVFALVERLDRLANTCQADARRNLGRLELRLIEMLGESADTLSEEQRRALELARGRALAAAGRGEEGVAALR